MTFNLFLALLAFGLSVSKPVQEARPSSGILQAGMVSLYATYLLVSGLSGETFKEGEQDCNPFSSGTQQLATVLGTVFTLVAIAYSASRAATKSRVLLGDGEVPKTQSAASDESALPLIINEAPAPTRTMAESHPAAPADTTLPSQQQQQPQDPAQPPASHIGAGLTPPKTDPANPAPKATGDQELIEIGVLPDSKSKRRHLEESVASGALPQSVLDEVDDGEPHHRQQPKKKPAKKADVESQGGDDDEEEEEEEGEDGHGGKGLSREDEREGCHYNYSYYHLVFCLAAMYVTMLINGWSTVNEENGELISVGHDWASVWVKVVSSWVCVLLYLWTLVAPILFPNRDWD